MSIGTGVVKGRRPRLRGRIFGQINIHTLFYHCLQHACMSFLRGPMDSSFSQAVQLFHGFFGKKLCRFLKIGFVFSIAPTFLSGYDISGSLPADHRRVHVHTELGQFTDNSYPVGRAKAFIPQTELFAITMDRHSKINAGLLQNIQHMGIPVSDQGIVKNIRDFAQLVVIVQICLTDHFFCQIQGNIKTVFIISINIGKSITCNLT